MQTHHLPRIGLRYWLAILAASIFGTNLGDLYAHNSGLGLLLGVLPLLAAFALTYRIEGKNNTAHELYYWLAVLIIRTGATNVGDYLAYRLRIPPVLLVPGLAAIIVILAWRGSAGGPLGKTTSSYWAAMLGAGVFGTVLGDICSHHAGQGPASLGLTLLLAIALATAKSRAASVIPLYWCTIAIARTAGTCIGDWLADTKLLHLGLPLSTLLTGAAFIAVLTIWRTTPRPASAAA